MAGDLPITVYWNIFWKTFAQMAAAALLAVGGAELLLDINAQGMAILLALLAAAVGGLVATGWAYVRAPADSAIEKALRSAAEKGIGVLVAIPINSAADLVTIPNLLIAGVGAVVLSGVVTYFQYQGAVPTAPT